MKILTKTFQIFSRRYEHYYSRRINNAVEKLSDKNLIEVSGKDSAALLQGLITNDIDKLTSNSSGSIYTMFLNTKGRVMYDSIIYKLPGTESYILEIDKASKTTLVKHILMYRLRKDVKVDIVDDKYAIWVRFNPELVPTNHYQLQSVVEENRVPCSADNSTGIGNILSMENGILTEFQDPRHDILGSRFLVNLQRSEDVMKNLFVGQSNVSYRMFRYRLGIAEGPEELPIGNCFPLEANCDYLRGVSFDKGCYIGQELTARTHHTGVIRKRYMPLYFHDENVGDIAVDTVVKNGEKNVGKLRGVVKNIGVGLLRIANVGGNQILTVNSLKCHTFKPIWWPVDKTVTDKDVAQM